MRRSLTSRSSSSSFNTGFSYSTIAVDPTAGGRGVSPDFYSANANCMFASFDKRPLMSMVVKFLEGKMDDVNDCDFSNPQGPTKVENSQTPNGCSCSYDFSTNSIYLIWSKVMIWGKRRHKTHAAMCLLDQTSFLPSKC
ncbi:hypothetical protein SLEP1_g27609 [Rubroshorea leprosula]|uniref:Uncharacterized protein n=1 Tax=Rubroshorea leprosula TaxID=152421 RepID=A0AAV5JXF3_9ROSI|nr:hypothetical protein SLEP1_g27609 [Rubroshorea leprosula]